MSLIRCFKCQKFWHTAIVPSQIWDGTVNNCKILYYYFIYFFSLLITDISLSSSTHLCLLSRLCLLYFSSTARRSPKATTRRCRSSVFSIPLRVLSFIRSLFLAVVWWVGSNGQFGGGWVQMGRSSSTTQHCPPHTLRSPISDADLCVFCCFCFSVAVVLVFCYGGSGVRQWWVGRWWLLAARVGCGLWWGWLVFLFCIFIYGWFF